MFLSATVTYGLIIVLLGYWFWHVWRRASQVKLDPAEESVFNVKRGTKKSCGCEEPCDCVSNTQAKRAAKIAKAQQLAEQQARPKRAARKSKGSPNESKPNQSTLKTSESAAVAAHSGKKSQNAQQPFNIIELAEELSDKEQGLTKAELPERWASALKCQGDAWTHMTSVEQREVETNYRKLTNTYTKLRTQRRKMLPERAAVEPTYGRMNDQNKFAVFEETAMGDSGIDGAGSEGEELAELVLNCEDYSPLDKVEFLKVLIEDTQEELYRLGDQGKLLPSPATAVSRRKAAVKSKNLAKKSTIARQQIQTQDYIPGLPANMMM